VAGWLVCHEVCEAKGFVRLDAEGSEARGGKDAGAGEKPPEGISQVVTTRTPQRRDGRGRGREWVHGLMDGSGCMEWSVDTSGASTIRAEDHSCYAFTNYPHCNVGHGSGTTATDYEAVNQCAK
jgi:hypothetical protein